MAVKIYAELILLTEFHKWSYHNEDSPNGRSSAFTLDKLYLDTDIDSETLELKKACLANIANGFTLSEHKIETAITALSDEVKSNDGELTPYQANAIIEASKIMSETRLLSEPLVVDLIWSQPLIWRMFNIFNRSQYLTVAAFEAKHKGLIAAKSFRNHYKAMMNRPVTHAVHQVAQHSKPFQEARLSQQ